MNDFALILFALIGLFSLLLLLKHFSRIKFCVLCVSVSLTWLTLLLLYKLDVFENGILLALLMGQSITGLYYLFEKKAQEKWHLFKFPLNLSLLMIFYLAITGQFLIESFSIIVALWILFILLFVYRENDRVQKVAAKIVACCRD